MLVLTETKRKFEMKTIMFVCVCACAPARILGCVRVNFTFATLLGTHCKLATLTVVALVRIILGKKDSTY